MKRVILFLVVFCLIFSCRPVKYSTFFNLYSKKLTYNNALESNPYGTRTAVWNWRMESEEYKRLFPELTKYINIGDSTFYGRYLKDLYGTDDTTSVFIPFALKTPAPLQLYCCEICLG